MCLAQLYHLRVLADLLAPPSYEVDCPPGTARSETDTCPPGDASLWCRQAGMIAAHTRGVINDFELVNEPDGRSAFLGTPQQYAAMLQDSYDTIHAANPDARVAPGGLMNIGTAGRRAYGWGGAGNVTGTGVLPPHGGKWSARARTAKRFGNWIQVRRSLARSATPVG
jgi:hypothetical protein